MSTTAPDWVTLTDGESVVWIGGPSRIRLVEELFGEALVVVVGLGLFVADPNRLLGTDLPLLRLVPLGFAVVALLAGGLSYLRFRSITYVLTTEQVYLRRGLVSRSVTNLRLEAIQDTGFSQSVLQRLLGMGDVEVSTAGEGDVEVVFTNVDDPASVNGQITEQLDSSHAEG